MSTDVLVSVNLNYRSPKLFILLSTLTVYHQNLFPHIFSSDDGDKGTISVSHKTSYRKILHSLKGARSVIEMLVSLWNLAVASSAVLSRHLPTFRAIGKISPPISCLRFFARSYDKMSFVILNWSPADSHYSNVWGQGVKRMWKQTSVLIQITCWK